MSDVTSVRFLATCFFCVLFGSAGFAADPLKDGGPQRLELARAVRTLFDEEDFARLEKIADKLWAEKSRFSDGSWKLHAFYEGFTVSSAEGARFDWAARFARARRWEEAFPQSVAAPIAHAWTLSNYAWHARGNDYADTVSDEGWKLFKERLHEMRALLQARPELMARPGYYEVMLTVALGESWPKPEYDQLFQKAVKLAPDYEPFYFSRAYSLQTKWYGAPGEWQKFALASAEATKAELGMALYTRIVWATVNTQAVKSFQEAQIDWPRMRQGFEDLLQRYPDSLWNKNAYCFFAYAANDRATVRRLLEELNNRFTPTLWSSAALPGYVKVWANNQPSPRP